VAVEVRDFRMADHTDFTRLVFELDGPAEYSIERDPAASVLVVNLEANGQAELQRSWGPWVKRVVVEPLLDVTSVRVELRDPEAQVVAERLEDPPRLVFDVGAGSSLQTLGDVAPPSVDVEPEIPTARSGSEPEAPAAAAEVAAATLDVAAPPPQVPAVPPADAKPASPPAPLESPRALPPDLDPERLHDPRSIVTQLADAERIGNPRTDPVPGPGGRLPGYGTLAGLLGVALAALLVWRVGRMGGLARGVAVLRRRLAVLRRARRVRARRGMGEVANTPPPPAPAVSEGSPAATDRTPCAPPEDSMLDATPENPEPLTPETAAPPAPRPAQAALPEESQLEALSYRVEALEFALERALEGRARLEAQLAEQGEQLRVQLAALARTQRAVRALSRRIENGREDRGLRG